MHKLRRVLRVARARKTLLLSFKLSKSLETGVKSSGAIELGEVSDEELGFLQRLP